jgi:hypothetical protein
MCLRQRMKTGWDFVPWTLIGRCQPPVNVTISAVPSDGRLKHAQSFTCLKSITSPIFFSKDIKAGVRGVKRPSDRPDIFPKNQKVTTNDMDQPTSHPPNRPVAEYPIVLIA